MQTTKAQARCYQIRFTIHASKYLICNHKQKEVSGAARLGHQQKATEIKIIKPKSFPSTISLSIQSHSIPAAFVRRTKKDKRRNYGRRRSYINEILHCYNKHVKKKKVSTPWILFSVPTSSSLLGLECLRRERRQCRY